MPREYSPGASVKDDFAHICDVCEVEGKPTIGWTFGSSRYFDICLGCLLGLAEEYCGEVVPKLLPIPLPTRSNPRDPIPEALRWEVFARDNFACKQCGIRAFLTVDHVIPVILGGLTVISNLQTLCRSCNSRKGAKVVTSI